MLSGRFLFLISETKSIKEDFWFIVQYSVNANYELESVRKNHHTESDSLHWSSRHSTQNSQRYLSLQLL